MSGARGAGGAPDTACRWKAPPAAPSPPAFSAARRGVMGLRKRGVQAPSRSMLCPLAVRRGADSGDCLAVLLS